MEMCESVFSERRALNERIAQELFETLPESGPVVCICGRDGERWVSDEGRFEALGLPEDFVGDLCARIDDGVEPVLTQYGNVAIVAMQLATQQWALGYVIFALPQSSPEEVLRNSALVEMVLNQIELVAKLVEQSEQLYRRDVSQLERSRPLEMSLN